ncbi:methyltransferase [Saccharopolyspora shandongensis]|uniref:methyltransferase n=1 Tax=Saccharopolyspora shandongensis TaxID=418495 RepID=UPI0034408265
MGAGGLDVTWAGCDAQHHSNGKPSDDGRRGTLTSSPSPSPSPSPPRGAVPPLIVHIRTRSAVQPLPAHGPRHPAERGRSGRDQAPARHQQRRRPRRTRFVELLGTITTGTPAYPHRYGRDFWADLDSRPELRRSFDAQMNWRFQAQAPQIAERFNWSRFSEILDVGGGDGTVLAAILHAHPGLRGRVLDLPPTATVADDRFAAAGLDGRAGAVSGSFFDPLPVGADAYLLSDILPDWDDEQARTILAGCRRAAAPSGTVVVIEPVLRQGVGTAIDLFMLMCFGGRERTVDELAELAADCGLVLRDSVPVADGRTALEFGVMNGPG